MESAVGGQSCRREADLGVVRSLAFALLVLAVPIALVATNIRFAASEPRVYDYSVREYDAALVSGIPEQELTRANRELVTYFTADDPGPLHIVVTNVQGEEEPLFSARETAHLGDVRDLFQGLFTVQMAAIALLLALAVVLIITSSVRALAQALLYGAALTTALVAATGALASLGFDSVWRQFHFLAFTNDLWQLDPSSDHLIQMFPRAFWFDITMLIGAVTLLQAMLVGGASGLYMYLTRHEAETKRPRPIPVHRSPEPRPRIPPPRPRRVAH